MTTTSNEDFAAHLRALAASAGPFEPTATYDVDGDCIEFLATPEPFYAERIDDLVTVYYSQDTKEIMGSLIKGVTRFCRDFSAKYPGFEIVIEAGNVRLEHLILAKLWSTQRDKSSVITRTYKKLIEVAGQTVIDGALCSA